MLVSLYVMLHFRAAMVDAVLRARQAVQRMVVETHGLQRQTCLPVWCFCGATAGCAFRPAIAVSSGQAGPGKAGMGDYQWPGEAARHGQEQIAFPSTLFQSTSVNHQSTISQPSSQPSSQPMQTLTFCWLCVDSLEEGQPPAIYNIIIFCIGEA